MRTESRRRPPKSCWGARKGFSPQSSPKDWQPQPREKRFPYCSWSSIRAALKNKFCPERGFGVSSPEELQVWSKGVFITCHPILVEGS